MISSVGSRVIESTNWWLESFDASGMGAMWAGAIFFNFGGYVREFTIIQHDSVFLCFDNQKINLGTVRNNFQKELRFPNACYYNGGKNADKNIFITLESFDKWCHKQQFDNTLKEIINE